MDLCHCVLVNNHWFPVNFVFSGLLLILFSHPITGFKDDSACVTTKTAVRITEDGLVVLNIIYMVYNIFHVLIL